MKKLIVISLLTIIASGAQAASSVTGTVKELYASDSGSVALTLTEGFSSELIQAECPSYNGYAGSQAPDPFLKSVLLAAQVSGKRVRLSISGCAGSWLKIVSVYLQP